MENKDLFLLIIELVMGFSATLTAIVLWSKTRKPAWTFVVLAMTLLYGKIIFKTLDSLGLFHLYAFTLYGVSVIEFIFVAFPFLFFTIGFRLLLRNRRRGGGL